MATRRQGFAYPHTAYAKNNPEVLNACIMCDKPGDLECEDCKSHYCSRACQIKDWRQHKTLCVSSTSTEFRLSSRPGPDYRRVIVLPVDGTQPVWDWARFDNSVRGLSDDEYRRLLRPVENDTLYGFTSINGLYSNKYLRFGRGLRRYVLTHSEGIDSDPKLGINHALQTLCNKPGHHVPQFGTLVYAAFSSDEIGRPLIKGNVEWGDATLKDLRLIVDLSLTDRKNPCVVDPERHVLGDVELWPALKLNCKGDMARFQLTPDKDIEPCLVSSVRGYHHRSGAYLPRILGLSWDWEYASATNESLIGSRSTLDTDLDFCDAFDCSYSTPLHWSEKKRTAWRKRHGFDHPGTMILMHEKGRQILRKHAEAVMEFADIASMSEIDRNRKEFTEFWYDYYGGLGVPSPYTLED